MFFYFHPEKIPHLSDNDPCGVGSQSYTLKWCSQYDGEKYPTALHIYSKNALVLHTNRRHFLKETKGWFFLWTLEIVVLLLFNQFIIFPLVFDSHNIWGGALHLK